MQRRGIARSSKAVPVSRSVRFERVGSIVFGSGTKWHKTAVDALGQNDKKGTQNDRKTL